jgi:hypothetical protein
VELVSVDSIGKVRYVDGNVSYDIVKVCCSFAMSWRGIFE